MRDERRAREREIVGGERNVFEREKEKERLTERKKGDREPEGEEQT